MRLPQPLLIEPVWNRNGSQRKPLASDAPAFNRTSMESKQAIGIGVEKLDRLLLIEPVWTSKLISVSVYSLYLFLLIEPVWNRNLLKYEVFHTAPLQNF